MKTLELVQGSPEWHAHRAKSHNASDAPALMGASPYRTRGQLIQQRATGIAPPIDHATQIRFDEGHRVEVLGRAIAEGIINDDLYPVVGESDDGYLSASFDGLTLDGTTAFECKLWNETKAEDVRKGHVPDCDWWQVVQQAVVSSALRIIYMVTDGAERTEYIEVSGDQARKCAGALVQAWRQFDDDVARYQARESKPQAVGSAPDQLPALRVEVEGKVLATNLDQFREHAMTVLGSINRDLKTDEDFADAESTVKWCKGVEDRLDAAKANVLAQMASVDEVCRTIDSVSAETRRVRLELDRLVKAEKENRRAAIVAAGIEAVRAHYASVNATLGEYTLPIPSATPTLIGQAIKGLKTLASIQNAADTAVAAAKIEASQAADAVRANIAVLDEFKDHAHLFADRIALAHTKSPEDLRNLCAARVADWQHQEAARLEAERERIRQEEQAKAQREEVERIRHIADDAPIVSAGDVYAEIVSPGPGDDDAPPIKLSDINAALYPVSIDGAGLQILGITQCNSTGRAKLYRARDFVLIRERIIQHVQAALLKHRDAA